MLSKLCITKEMKTCVMQIIDVFTHFSLTIKKEKQ